jgi:hypothetical protein
MMNPGFYSLYCKLGCNEFNKQLGSLHPETQNTVTLSQIKRKRKFYSIYKGIQNGSVAKSYMRKGFLIYLTICDEAVSNI